MRICYGEEFLKTLREFWWCEEFWRVLETREDDQGFCEELTVIECFGVFKEGNDYSETTGFSEVT